MDTLVLSTLIIQSLGSVVTVLLLALGACLPGRRAPRRWTSTDAVQPAALPQSVNVLGDATELPRAA